MRNLPRRLPLGDQHVTSDGLLADSGLGTEPTMRSARGGGAADLGRCVGHHHSALPLE